jgi:hypothetical protein
MDRAGAWFHHLYITMGAESQEKYTALNHLLEEQFVLVHLCPSCEGVTLPPHLMAQSSITLKISRLFRGGMKVHKDRVVAQLLFGDDYFACVVPFNAIWGLSSARGARLIWPESMPQEILNNAQTQEQQEVPPQEQSDKDKPVGKPLLRRVK